MNLWKLCGVRNELGDKSARRASLIYSEFREALGTFGITIRGPVSSVPRSSAGVVAGLFQSDDGAGLNPQSVANADLGECAIPIDSRGPELARGHYFP